MNAVTNGTEVLDIDNISEAVLEHSRHRRAFCYGRHEVTKPIRRLEDLNLAFALLHEGTAM